jgi:hypothetical protein
VDGQGVGVAGVLDVVGRGNDAEHCFAKAKYAAVQGITPPLTWLFKAQEFTPVICNCGQIVGITWACPLAGRLNRSNLGQMLTIASQTA